MAAALALVGGVSQALQLGGLALSTVGAISQANAQKAAANAAAEEQKRAATEATAVAQRKEYDERKKTDYAQSRLRSVAAASGGGTEGTVLDLASEIEAQGKFNRDVAMYEGESRASKLKTQAALTKLQGKTDYQGALFSAGANLLSGLHKYSQRKA